MNVTERTAFTNKIIELHKQLDIPADYAKRHQLQPCEECLEGVSIGRDIFDREQLMLPSAAAAWRQMQEAAAAAGIELQVVSAYRSIEYQAGIISRKLEAGQSMQEILLVSAAPGYSEHHTGRALDLTTAGFEPLDESFEESPAFEWLQGHASRFGFRMSFPRDNPHALCYEPWHWCWTPPDA